MATTITANSDGMLRAVHRGLVWLLLFGLAGLEVELVLLRHTDGVWQLLPLVLMGATLLVMVWYMRSRMRAAVRVLQGAMWLFIASGVAGTVLHYQGNVVYESESNPGLAGRELYQAAVQGSTPTLAPGAMIQLGLLGLIVAYCGVRLRAADVFANASQPAAPVSQNNSPGQHHEV